MMPVGYRQLLEAADAAVVSVDCEEARRLIADPGVTLVDIRDPRELERDGMIAGALHAPRGMLEFWIDSESPYHKPAFAEDKRFLFYCAGGWRSLLATKLAQDMGLAAINLNGGFKQWREDGLPVVPYERRSPPG